MALQRRSSKDACHCTNSPPLASSTLLFLYLLLPRSSYAQITNAQQPPTAFATLISPSPSTQSSPPDASISGLQSGPPSPSGDPSENSSSRATFNYYFLVVAVAAIIVCMGLLWFGKRKKQKAAMMRSNSQRALERDVAGFRARPGRVRNVNGRVFGLGARREEFTVEGLNERGEAPPPYALGTKPPSLRSTASLADLAERGASGRRNGEAVELRDWNTGTTAAVGNGPPGYHEHTVPETRHGSENIGNVARPTAAVVAQSRRADNEANRDEPIRSNGGSAV